ncbi:MAG: hypothetical protein KGJ43_00985 [Acidobacteriota bacterium]|nr:hypothetical protein [Acidobacteriota bacterium]
MIPAPPKLLSHRAARATLVACVALFSVGSPWVATSVAETGGADVERSETFGDCAHLNEGVHNGYDCQVEVIPA